MVAKRRPLTAEERAETEFQDELAQAAKRIASDLGPAPGTVRTSEAKKRALWWTKDPNVDRMTMTLTLMQQGLPPEQIGALMIAEERPDLAPAYQQQAPDEPTAALLAAVAEWPFRLSVLAQIEDAAERIRESDRLTNLGPPQSKQGADTDGRGTPTEDATRRLADDPFASAPATPAAPGVSVLASGLGADRRDGSASAQRMRDPMMPAAAPAGRY